MISQIKIAHFKAFPIEIAIELKALTVLAGTNSAGKSTLLQAIIALKQSIEIAPKTGSLELNGQYLRLGMFKDALSREALNPCFQLGLTFSDNDGNSALSYIFKNVDGRPKIDQMSYIDDRERLILQMRPRPESVDVILDHIGLLDALSCSDNSDTWFAMTGPAPSWEISLLPSSSNISRVDHLRSTATNKIIEIIKLLLNNVALSGAEIRTSLQQIERDLSENNFDALTKSLERLLSITQRGPNHPLTHDVLEAETLKLLAPSLSETHVDLLKLLFYFPETELETLTACETLAQHSRILPETGYSLNNSGRGGRINQRIKTIFDKIVYLGPLRRPPLLSYAEQPGQLSKILPDGTGLMAHLQARWNSSTDFESPSGDVTATTVGDCVNLWCRRLGLSNGLEIYGSASGDYEIRFIPRVTTTSDNQNVAGLDLPTNVGVGVSQLLPIISLLIIADQGTICLLEQPELHLHPSVQTKLAELFTVAIKTGRQLIIETHSEHLINGIRLAVAEQRLRPSDTALLFVTSNLNSCDVQSITMDTRGFIDEWPSGFFDEAEKGALRLLGATLKK